MRQHPALTPLVFLLLAVIWTWPAILAPGLVGRMPDAAGTAWFLWASPRLLLNLHDGLTGWPAGVTYGRPDSYLLLLVGPLLSWVGPARAHAWIAVFGLAASAWGAEAFARTLGARAPWSGLAGLAFAFTGLASSALLEGYVYHLVNPWLPLLALSWFRATRPKGTVGQGLAAALFFVLCLLTTAWMALAAMPLVVGFLAAALLRQGRALDWRPVGPPPAVALPAFFYLACLRVGRRAGSARPWATRPLDQLRFGPAIAFPECAPEGP